jgi:hypothetical protein
MIRPEVSTLSKMDTVTPAGNRSRVYARATIAEAMQAKA